MPGFNAFVFQTATGRIVMRDLPFVGNFEASREINQPGMVGFKLVVDDMSTPSTQTLRSVFTPWRFSIGIAWGEYIIQAGPIITSQFDDGPSILSITAGGIWRILDRRVIMNPAIPPVPTTSSTFLPVDAAQDANYGPFSLHTIAKKLVQASGTRSGFSLPIDFPADIAGTAVRNYPIYDMATVGQRLQELTQVEGGPDIDFAPYFDPSNPGFVRWQMRIGNPTLQQTGLELVWDYGTGLRTLSVDSNGSKMATGVYVKGNGTERASLVSYQEDMTRVNAGWPGTEMIETKTSVTDAATLQGHANGAIAVNRNPVEMWTATVRADISPVLGTYEPGTYAVFNMQNHPWIPDGRYLQRILGFSPGSSTNDIGLILQAIEGSV